jgi:hypothetical protein
MSTLANRFLSAVRTCTGPLAIKRRLAMAWLEHLDMISPCELPGNLRQDFIELRKAMYTRNPLPSETAPQASIRKMSSNEAAVHAHTIILLYSRLVLHESVSKQLSAKEGAKSVTKSRELADSVPTVN